ncbi:MAG: endolytic transglycosylase MltG [Chloroflexota bacterium]
MLRLAKIIILLGFIMLFIGVVAGGFLFIVSGGEPIDYVRTAVLRWQLAGREDELAQPASSDISEQIFEIPLGTAPFTIANNLQMSGLITDAELFVLYAQVEGYDREFEAGTYFLSPSLTIPQIAQMLTDSSNSAITFRVVEGWRIEEIADAIDQNPRFSFTGNDFLALVGRGAQFDQEIANMLGIPNGSSLEGFMFPDTYVLSANVTASELVNTLVSEFVSRTGEQMRLDAGADGYTMYDIVTIASIVERESVWNDENVLIASVYRNRLDIDMLLQADPTVQYGLDNSRGRYWANITVADYQGVNSPYNTYIYSGLPPGPIANPSLSAIRASVYPASSNYIFFRARCDGSNRHNFAVTFDEHLANAC